MAELIFSRDDGTIYLMDGNGELVDLWDAGNNAKNPWGDPFAEDSNAPAPNGEWDIDWGVQEKSRDAYGGENEEFIPIGDYGKDGCQNLDAIAIREIGIHGGRDGPEFETEGCIRMYDKDIAELAEWMKEHAANDKVNKITIQTEPALIELPDMVKYPPPPPPVPEDPENGGDSSFGAGGSGSGSGTGSGTGTSSDIGTESRDTDKENGEEPRRKKGVARKISLTYESTKNIDPDKLMKFADKMMDKLYFIQNSNAVMKEKYPPLISDSMASPEKFKFALAATHYLNEWEIAALQVKSAEHWIRTFDFATQDWRWIIREGRISYDY